MEQEARETGSVTRNQNALYVMPHDWASIAQFLEPLIDRIDIAIRDVQLLVIAPDADSAAAIAAAAVKLIADRDIQIIAATSASRAARLIKLRPSQVVTGTASTVAELLRGAAIKLDAVRSVCIAWADELLTRGDTAALESVMTELPKDSARTIVAGDLTPAVEEIVERYARRARRVIAAANETDAPIAVEYVAGSRGSRAETLRRVLDAVDPTSALVFVREGESRNAVVDSLRSIGYPGDAEVKAGRVAAPGTALAVLFDLPASREEMREAASGAARTIAIVQPRQLASLRALAAGGVVKPFTLPETGQQARDTDARTRSELRAVLDEGHFGRELLALEPLLDDFDGVEIAAAALQLVERERKARQNASASAPAASRTSANMVKLFVTVGARDDAGPGDIVGAFANEGGISSAEVGRVDVRESHSIVEVSANVADTVIERVTGTTIRGRRAVVRRDESIETRAARPSRGGERGDRGDRGASRGDRGDRGAPRGDRGSARSDRGGPRGPRSDRGERSDRPDRGAPRGERSDRGDRGGDRPPRRPRPEGRGE